MHCENMTGGAAIGNMEPHGDKLLFLNIHKKEECSMLVNDHCDNVVMSTNIMSICPLCRDNVL